MARSAQYVPEQPPNPPPPGLTTEQPRPTSSARNRQHPSFSGASPPGSPRSDSGDDPNNGPPARFASTGGLLAVGVATKWAQQEKKAKEKADDEQVRVEWMWRVRKRVPGGDVGAEWHDAQPLKRHLKRFATAVEHEDLGVAEHFLSVCWHVAQCTEEEQQSLYSSSNPLHVPCADGRKLTIYVADFPKIGRPLHYLMERGQRRDWDNEADETAEVLEDRLSARWLACEVAQVVDQLWRAPATPLRPLLACDDDDDEDEGVTTESVAEVTKTALAPAELVLPEMGVETAAGGPGAARPQTGGSSRPRLARRVSRAKSRASAVSSASGGDGERLTARDLCVELFAPLSADALPHLDGMWRRSAFDAVLCAGQPDALSAMLVRKDGSAACITRPGVSSTQQWFRTKPAAAQSPQASPRGNPQQGSPRRSFSPRGSVFAEAEVARRGDLWRVGMDKGEAPALHHYLDKYGRSLISDYLRRMGLSAQDGNPKQPSKWFSVATWPHAAESVKDLHEELDAMLTNDGRVISTLESIPTQRAWNDCVQLFRKEHPSCHDGSLQQSVESEISRDELTRLKQLMREKGIKWVDDGLGDGRQDGSDPEEPDEQPAATWGSRPSRASGGVAEWLRRSVTGEAPDAAPAADQAPQGRPGSAAGVPGVGGTVVHRVSTAPDSGAQPDGTASVEWRGHLWITPKERWVSSFLPTIPAGWDVQAARPAAASGATSWKRRPGESFAKLRRRLRRLTLRQLVMGALAPCPEKNYDRFGMWTTYNGSCGFVKLLQRCQWILHDADIIARLDTVLRDFSGVDIADTPAPQDVAKLMEVNARVRESKCDVQLYYRKDWKVCRRTDMPGHREIVRATNLSLLHWVMLLNSPKMMVLIAEIISKYHKMAATEKEQDNLGVQLCRPWRAVRAKESDVKEYHSALFLACYSASLTKRHIVSECGFPGWQMVAKVFAIESQTIGHKVTEYGESHDLTDVLAGGLDGAKALIGLEEGDDGINVDEVDGRHNPFVIACQNGHAMVLDSLLKSAELEGLADVLQKTEDGVDAHDCALLLLRRAQMQKETQEVMDTLEYQLSLLQDTESIKSKLKAKNSVFYFQALTAMIFVVIVMFVVSIANDGSHYWTIASVRSAVVNTEYVGAHDLTAANGLQWSETLDDVGEVNLIKQWFSEAFCAKIVRPWSQGGHGGEGGGRHESGFYGMWTIIGAIQVGKFDAHNGCINGSALTNAYYGDLESRHGCFSDDWLVMDRGLATDSRYWSHRTHRRLRTDLPDSLYLHPADFASPLTTSRLADKEYRHAMNANLSIIVDTDWISPATRLVSLHFVVYHPNSDVFVVVEVYWEIVEFGEVYPSYRFSAVSTQPPESKSDSAVWWLFRIWVCYLTMLQVYQFVVDLNESIQMEKDRTRTHGGGVARKVLATIGPQRIVKFIWNFLVEWLWDGGDLLDLALLATAIFAWWSREIQFQLQERLNAAGVLQPGHDEFNRDFILLARAADSFRMFTGALVLLSWLWLAKIMRRLGSVGDIVFAILATITAREVLTFFVLFISILIGFWQALYCIFGPRIEGLEDYKGSFLATLRMFLGDMGDEFLGAVESNQDIALVLFVLLMIGVIIFFLNVLIAVISEAYGQAYRPGIYLDWFAKEIYVKQYLLLPPTHHRGCVLLGSFGIHLTHVLYSIGILKPPVDPDDNFWEIVSTYGLDQFKSMLRQRDTTSGEVADVAHQIAAVVKDNNDVTHRIASNMDYTDRNVSAVISTVSQNAKQTQQITETLQHVVRALNDMRADAGKEPVGLRLATRAASWAKRKKSQVSRLSNAGSPVTSPRASPGLTSPANQLSS